MRIQTRGVERRGEPFAFSFDGETVPAFPGESIAAALVAAGQWRFREARDGAARGMFCGMGVCGECQVQIDGRSRRACLEPALPGLDVRHSPALASVPGRDAAESGSWSQLTVDVLVVGAGPAGLAAASAAALAGLGVLVVDERGKAGGQFFKQPGAGFEVDEQAIDAQFAEGRQLYRRAIDAGARFLFGATVWGAFSPSEVAIVSEGRTQLITARRLILATGAYERCPAIPGWTLPGVITTGAAQTLLRAYQTAPGKRVLVAGNGPLNLQVANELSRSGVTVVAVAETAASPWLASPSLVLRLAWNEPSLWLAGIGQLAALKLRGVPIHYRYALVAASGDSKVRRATLARIDTTGRAISGTEKHFDVDAVCVNAGFLPQAELPRALGCEFHYDAASASLHAKRDEDGRSSVRQVFIVGDAGGLGGARIASAQGTLAGAAAARDLHPGTSSPLDLAGVRRTLHRHRRFQDALWRMFKSPVLTTQLAAADTLVCRCEEVAKSTVESCLREQACGLGTLKRATRAGMGRCQGRYCTLTIAALMGELGVGAPRADEFFAPRAPFKPVPLAQLAGAYGDELPAADLLRTTGRDAHKPP